MKLLRCWVCDVLISDVRREQHHVGGKETSHVAVQICILCHDLVDRLDADIPDVFKEFENLTLPKDRRLRLFLLKVMHGYGLAVTHNIERQLLIAACNAYTVMNTRRNRKIHEELRRQGRRAGRKKSSWDVQRARELKAQGLGWRAIAKEIGVSYQTVRRELREYPAGTARV